MGWLACTAPAPVSENAVSTAPQGLLRGELETGPLCHGRGVSGACRVPECSGLVEDKRPRGTEIGFRPGERDLCVGGWSAARYGEFITGALTDALLRR